MTMGTIVRGMSEKYIGHYFHRSYESDRTAEDEKQKSINFSFACHMTRLQFHVTS